MAKKKDNPVLAEDSVMIDKKYDMKLEYQNFKDGSVHSINVMRRIPFVDVCLCVENIVNAVIDDERYAPYFLTAAFKGNIIESYTDFDTSIGFDKMDEIIENTNIFSVVRDNISGLQCDNIEWSADELIEFKKQRLIHKSEFNDFVNDLRGLLNKFDKAFDEKMFDSETIKNALSNIASMNVSEQGLVDALINKAGINKGKISVGKSDKKTEKKNKVVHFPTSEEMIGQIDMSGSEVVDEDSESDRSRLD